MSGSINEVAKYLREIEATRVRLLGPFNDAMRAVTEHAAIIQAATRSYDQLFRIPQTESLLKHIQGQGRMIEAIRNSIASQRLLQSHEQLFKNSLATEFSAIDAAQKVMKAFDLSSHIAAITSPINDVLRGISAHLPFNDLLARTNSVLDRSESAIVAVNDFFSTPSIIDVESVQTAPVLELNEASNHLQVSAAGTVVAGNDLTCHIRSEAKGVIRDVIAPFEHVLRRMELLASPRNFLDVLFDFALGFARDHWRALWQEFGAKYHSRPEQIAKAVLGSYLRGVSFGTSFVGSELGAGDGWVDLLVNIMGLNQIVELKVIGASGQGISWAKSGTEQLSRYMKSFDVNESFLVVFDGRKTNQGEQLEESYLVDGRRVHVVVVRVYFDSP